MQQNIIICIYFNPDSTDVHINLRPLAPEKQGWSNTVATPKQQAENTYIDYM
jgi:hypothetical protein